MSRKRQSRNIILETPDLKAQLQELARVDFDRFMRILGIDGVQIFICADKTKGLTLQQIANRLKVHGIAISRQSVGDRCRKCEDPEEENVPGA